MSPALGLFNQGLTTMPTQMTHSPAPSTKFQPRTLFGLPGNAPAMKAAYPLCDRAGAPACGNVGQPGRPDAPVATWVHCEEG
jgi:hypothetical protein